MPQSPSGTVAARALQIRANIALLALVCFWGSMVPFMALLLTVFDPYFLAVARYVIALPFLWLLVILQRSARGPLTPLLRIAALGAAMCGFSFLYTFGIQFSHPVTASVILASGPIVAAIMGRVMFAIPFDRRLALALPLTVSGGILVALGAPRPIQQGLGIGGGEALLVIAQICWNWYTMQAQRWMPGASQIRVSAVTSTAASLWTVLIWVALWLAGIAHVAVAPVPLTLAGLLVWISVTGVAIAIVLWNFAASVVSVPVAALFMNLGPVVAALTAYALGIEPTWMQIAGGVVVMAGVAYMQAGRLRDNRAPG